MSLLWRKSIGLLDRRSLLLNVRVFSLNEELLERHLSLGISVKQLKADDNNPEVRNTEKDRTKVIPVEDSIRYLLSEAYKITYGNDPVWVKYRRNHKGLFPPRKTRKTCIRQGMIATGNPCPICRDEYLILEHRNVGLLQQFISPYNGEILSYTKTGICQKKYQELLVAVEKAKDYGFITFDVPFRIYDYSQYCKTS